MCHDQMMFGVDRDLHVVANDAGATPARRHGSRVRIGQRDLLIGRSQHLLLIGRELRHLLFQLNELFLEARRLQCERLRWLVTVGRIELAQIPRHTFFELRASAIDLAAREIPIPIVDRLELAAVNGDARFPKQTHLATQIDEARAHLADRRTIVLAEIGNHLVIGDEPAKKPHHLEIAASLTLEPSARLHAVEIAVDVELQKNRRMIGGPAGRRRRDTVKPKRGEIERINERVYYANRIALVDPVIQAFGQQCRLPAIRPHNKALHEIPRRPPGES